MSALEASTTDDHHTIGFLTNLPRKTRTTVDYFELFDVLLFISFVCVLLHVRLSRPPQLKIKKTTTPRMTIRPCTYDFTTNTQHSPGGYMIHGSGNSQTQRPIDFTIATTVLPIVYSSWHLRTAKTSHHARMCHTHAVKRYTCLSTPPQRKQNPLTRHRVTAVVLTKGCQPKTKNQYLNGIRPFMKIRAA